jgi:hypothetical protein
VLSVTAPVLAQRFETLNGPPVQMQPYVNEPGAPEVVITTGTPAFGGLDTDMNDTSSGENGSGTGGTTGGGGSGSSEALTTMLGRSWGSQVAANAQSLGVNASAVAATCVVESGCGANVGNGSGAQGVFQMYSPAFNEGLQTALASNPGLASQIVSGSAGMNDPVTEGIAATGYLMQASQALQNAGVSNPTVIDARGYYNFGPKNGVALATADPSLTMAEAMPSVSAATFAQNGISSGETVAQWKASVSAKIGSAANQTLSN